MKCIVLLLLFCVSGYSQTTYWASGLLRQPSAALARQYLGISAAGVSSVNGLSGLITLAAGANVALTTVGNTITISSSGGGGSGSVTNFSSGNATPLFTTTVGNPTTNPSLMFTLLYTPATNSFAGITNALGYTPFDLANSGQFVGTNQWQTNFNAQQSSNTIYSSKQPGNIKLTNFVLLANASGVLTNDGSGNYSWVAVGGDSTNGVNTVLTNFIANQTASNLIYNAKQPGNITLTNLSALANASGVLTNNGSGTLSWVAVGGGGSGGGSTAAIDYAMTNLLAYSTTNYAIDFAWPAAVLLATGDIAFRYSTNWPSTTTTSRFSRIFIPASNGLRRIYIYGDATNWLSAGLAANTTYLAGGNAALLTAHIFGQGETNVTLTYQSTKSIVSNPGSTFDPSGVAGLTLWLDAARGIYQDTNAATPVTVNGQTIKRWNDLSSAGNHVTNNLAAVTWTQFGGPLSLPSVAVSGGVQGFLRRDSGTLNQPTTVFLVANRASGTLVAPFLDGGFGSLNTLNVSLTATSNLTANAGTAMNANTNFPGLTYFQSTTLFNGSLSNIRTNGVTTGVTNNAGTSVPIGFTVGNIGGSIVTTSIKNIAEILVYNSTLSTTDRNNIESYLLAKYGLP